MQRERLLQALVEGSGCPICDRPMFRDKARNHDGLPLHADHWPIPRAIAGPRALASRLTCGSCNMAAGGRLRAAIAGERMSDHSEADHDRLAFAWP